MIRFDSENFLHPEYCEKLQKAGIDMNSTKYVIIEMMKGDELMIMRKDESFTNVLNVNYFIPTVTLSELLEVLPKEIKYKNKACFLQIFKDTDFFYAIYTCNGECLIKTVDQYPIMSAYKMLLRLSNDETIEWVV